MKKIAFIGGDMRFYYASEYLKKSGHEVFFLNFRNTGLKKEDYIMVIRECDVLVLPAPLSCDGKHIRGTVNETGELTQHDIYSLAKADGLVLTCKVPRENIFDASNIRNYMLDNTYVTDMAYITAEGALGHILLNSACVLSGANTLIIGWGRIAKFMHRMLLPFTDRITVVLRNEDEKNKLINSGRGAVGFDKLKNCAGEADIIVNTVPHPIMGTDIIDSLKPDVYLADLASLPGGADISYAQKRGLAAFRLPGLPGIAAPGTAGKKLAECVLRYIDAPAN